jgi:phytoene dehydrogenase-like protein
MRMPAGYDGIVIGGGHNGMILASYLALEGLRVLVVEANLELGGGLDSHDDPVHPGHWHQMHSVFHRNVSALDWYRDLGLDREPGEYLRPELGVAMCLRDGSSLLWYRDVEKTIASIAKTSEADAKTFRELHRQWVPIAREIAVPEMYAPPLPRQQREKLLSKSALGRTFLEFCRYTPEEVILQNFEDDRVRAFLGFLVMMRGFDLDVRGVGSFVPTMIATGVNPELCRGTSHGLAHRLHATMVSLGADLIETRAVSRILIEGGRAVGVELSDGSQIRAEKFVVSSVNPQITFLQMVGEDHLDAETARKARGYKYSATTPIFSVNLALNDRPRYLCEEREPDIARTFMAIVGLDGFQDLKDLTEDTRAGRLPRKLFMNGACPSVHDVTQAPPGKHTAFMWQLAPYFLDGDPENWDRRGPEVLEAEIAMWREYAPNLDEKNIRHKLFFSPLDIERHDANMRQGDWMIGEYNENQMLDRRPFEGCGQYRTPIRGLYLCGSCCHPYGNITGGPGYNAAQVVARDLGLDPWWRPADVVERWSRLPA